ncbi:MAG TPA: cytochrome c biogenesis protein CcsA, partial [Candidatus Polarisedimenticolaceae bacterium]|nr:cytochrome c biogenesis protein CcsA [Candidatus Polarisedimenticolaceae bacterium]
MNLGDLLIKLSALFAVVAFVEACRWARGRTGSRRRFRWAYHGMTLTLLAASALLVLAILRHDFRFEYVIGYSSRDLPLIYLLSAFWAGQQGTYLLWGLVGALFGYFLFRERAWEQATVMAFYLPTVAFMHLLMLDPNGNPFRLATSVPPDGRGLNPLLQDPWMASHPPAIFVGYVAATIPAVLALVALVKRREEHWVSPALRWTLLSFVLLGAGIVLGGFWAYKVLGWGGYWGWDPVENASLIPWIVVTALVHGLIVQKATGALPRTNLALALAGYATVFYATFLTRSGVLADFSVHSFPAGSIYRILLGIQLAIVAVSLVLFFRRWSIGARDVPLALAWPLVLAVAVVLFVLSAGLVLIGTSWPIITTWLGKPSSFGPSWYNTVSLPIYVALLALLGVAPLLAWARRPIALVRRRLALTVAAAMLATAIALALGSRGLWPLALFFVAAAALVANALRLVEVGRGRWLNSGAALAHIGFALMLLGIAGSS